MVAHGEARRTQAGIAFNGRAHDVVAVAKARDHALCFAIGNTLERAADVRAVARHHVRLARRQTANRHARSEEHTSELQSLMRTSYAVFCLKKKKILLYL